MTEESSKIDLPRDPRGLRLSSGRKPDEHSELQFYGIDRIPQVAPVHLKYNTISQSLYKRQSLSSSAEPRTRSQRRLAALAHGVKLSYLEFHIIKQFLIVNFFPQEYRYSINVPLPSNSQNLNSSHFIKA
ncbi:hypothetical protein M9H77_31751 [Catharanthus roseus]|uniref:Uncharacterized protein n=1 Tax=Catharanthus roseus TaxID=4058 RepID=A0ACC0A1D2_CATRO|nr:hypothetical protein M9H77_31751 [Catharanthus roseus]